MPEFIPVNEPVLDGSEQGYLDECIRSGWISSEGPFVKAFEEKVAATVGRKHGIGVSSGSAALDVAVAALEIGPGDEVILPTLTIISCAAAVVRAGAAPVVVDCDPGTWNMTAEGVEAALTPRTRAIMVVHLYGLPVDLDPILAIAEREGIPVIEDAAEMLGQEYRGRPCGSFGRISVLSFYPNKHVTTGEGGMLLTDDEDLAERCRRLRNLCFQPDRRRFVHEELGWNYRLTNLQAAVGLAQLERLDEFVARKRRMGRHYDSLLEGLPGIRTPVRQTDYAENIYWVYAIVLEDVVPFDAESAMNQLADRGVGTRPFFWPMHEQPVFRARGWFQGIECPAAERAARRGLYLPSGLGLTSEQVERSAAALTELLD